MTYLFTEILVIGWYTQRYIRELVKKLGQFRERHMTLNCLLTHAHLNSIWKVNSAKVHFYLLTCELKKNSIICWQVRREIKEYMLHKKETYNLVKSKHVTYISMCMNTAIK